MRLGADPEVFTIDSKTGKFLSIIGKIGANKHNPLQIAHMPQGFTLQEDNVALEFGIPPATNAKEFSDHIEKVLQEGLSILPGRMFSTLSCVVFPKDQMNDPEAHVFGCEPDYNAWTEEVNKKPVPPHPFMRSAGGHVHIETTKNPFSVARACDLFLGVPSILMDTGDERRKLYGGAGACRVKPYGVEYRTLSNFWIFKPELREWVWRQSERALDMVGDKKAPILYKDVMENITSCINNGDKKLAENLVNQFQLELV